MNPIKGEVPLNLQDGRQYTLVLDMEALVEAETLYGKPLQQLMADAAGGFVGAVRAVLYGALRARHPQITPRDASAMFASDGDSVRVALEAAGEQALSGGGEGASAEGKEGANPRGKTSGRSGAKPD